MYEDDDIAVVDKPVGVAAHPSPGWTGPTVTGSSRRLRRDPRGLGGRRARGDRAPARRRYLGPHGCREVECRLFGAQACVQGARGRQDVPRDSLRGTSTPPRGPSTRRSVVTLRRTTSSPSPPTGRHSVTHYVVLEMMPAASLLEIELETGRTHQIRVHMAALRHPLVGDLTYGADPALAPEGGAHAPVAPRREARVRPSRLGRARGVLQPVSR